MNNFYPRPPRGGRPAYHAPCEQDARFLSTPSARRATHCGQLAHLLLKISIHALREEGDPYRCARVSALWNFYPRPPRGGRLPAYRALIPAV